MMVRDLDADNIAALVMIGAISLYALYCGQTALASAGLGIIGGYIAK